MIIYRLENQAGTGIYRIKGDELNEILDRYENRPLPEEDYLLVHNLKKTYGNLLPAFWLNRFCFGFASVAQFRLWFASNEDLERFWRQSIGVAVYDIKTVYMGYHQVAFPVEQKNLTSRKKWLYFKKICEHGQ